jgi:transmembrane sensor
MKTPVVPMDCTCEQIDEAAVWMTLLHSQDRSATTEQGFRKWLEAHPAHPIAFEQVSIAHEVTAAISLKPLPPADLWRRHEAGRAKGGVTRGLSLAAAVCVIAVAAVFAFGTFSTRVYSTDVGEQRTLTLADGTQVFLNTSSSIAVRYDKRYRSIELEEGEALFDVAKGDPKRPFIVTADNRHITALGTAFLVRVVDSGHGRFPLMNRSSQAGGSRLQITLLNGKVIVSDTRPDGDEAFLDRARPPHEGSGRPPLVDGLVLRPGQRLTMAPNVTPKVDNPNLEKVTAWRSGRVEFDRVKLADAVAEMNRYSAVRLTVERPEAENLTITGTFRAGTASSFAQAMAAAYRLEVIERADEIVLAGRPDVISRPKDTE